MVGLPIDARSYAQPPQLVNRGLRFRFGTDLCNGTEVGWYLDDTEVYDCR